MTYWMQFQTTCILAVYSKYYKIEVLAVYSKYTQANLLQLGTMENLKKKLTPIKYSCRFNAEMHERMSHSTFHYLMNDMRMMATASKRL